MSVVQPLLSLQASVPELVHMPLSQRSPVVHWLLSSHERVLGAYTQVPALQVPAALYTRASVGEAQSGVGGVLQTTGAPAQVPALQVSPVVQALPSSQAPATVAYEHTPLVQVPIEA